MKRWVVVSMLGLGLMAPSVSMACGMYIPSPEGKTLAIADALEAIDAESVKKEKLADVEKKAEVKPEALDAKKVAVEESEKKPNS